MFVPSTQFIPHGGLKQETFFSDALEPRWQSCLSPKLLEGSCLLVQPWLLQITNGQEVPYSASTPFYTSFHVCPLQLLRDPCLGTGPGREQEVNSGLSLSLLIKLRDPGFTPTYSWGRAWAYFSEDDMRLSTNPRSPSLLAEKTTDTLQEVILKSKR